MEEIKCTECGQAAPLYHRPDWTTCSAACRQRRRRRMNRNPIPQELRDRSRWVVWKYRDGKKVPYQSVGGPASSADPRTWTEYENVKNYINEWPDGIGFVLNGDGIACVDIDDCFTPNGYLTTAARTLLGMTGATYVEISPSGNGLHIWGYGKMPSSGRVKKFGTQKVEAYSTGRYITVTGKTPPVSFDQLVSIQQLLDFVDSL